MKRFLRLLVFLPVSLSLLCACGPGAQPVATSLVSAAPEQTSAPPTATPAEDEGSFAQPDVPPFGADDKLLGLPLPATRGECSAILGMPSRQLPSADNTTTVWDYGDMRLYFARNEEGDLLLGSIAVLAGEGPLLRGLTMGATFEQVLGAFLISGKEGDAMVDDVLPLYRNEQSRGELLLPPRGTLGYGDDTDDYDKLLEYVYPAQPYAEDLINGDQAAFIYEPHYILRFYFLQDIVTKCELSLQAFDVYGLETPAPDTPVSETPAVHTPAPGTPAAHTTAEQPTPAQ